MVEIDCPLHLAVACLAERSQIPRQEITLVTVQVVNCEEVRWRAVIKARFIVQPLTTDERNDPAKLTQNYSGVIKKVVENA